MKRTAQQKRNRLENAENSHKMKIISLLMLAICHASYMQIKADSNYEQEMDADADTDTGVSATSAMETELSNEFPTSNDDGGGGSYALEDSEETRIRNLNELDISVLGDYCTIEGVCRDLIYDNPQEAVFFESKPKVRFTSDTTYVFKPAPQYDVLRFVDSKFANFPVNLFYSLKIKELDMRHCNMQRLTWDNFLMADELSILLLSYNRLKEIKPLTFNSAEKLQFLFLDSNEIDTLYTQSFKDLTKLFMLDLHNNQLATLPPGIFSYLPAFQQLNLAENRLTTITDGTFANNIRLTSVNMQRNFLTSLDEYVFQNQDYMDYVDLSHNPELESLVGNIRVDNLWARNCSLTRVNIYGKAKNVDLQKNHIMELYFSQPEYVETLRLNDNSLQQLSSLDAATNLVFFDISSNPGLKTLPELWEVDSLERLDLSNTSLRSIPLSVIESPERLTSLNVSYNLLTHIEPTHFQYYEKLQYFYMHQNNWNCYSLQLFMDMVVRPFKISYTLDDYDEQFPGEYIGGIKCMYRIREEGENENGEILQDQLNISGLSEQLNEAPENSDTAEEPSEVELLRREFKAVVGIYEQKFSTVLNKLEAMDQRLKRFEMINKTMWQHVTITV